MTFLLDHDVPAEVARILSHEGHSVVRLVQVLPRNAPDRAVLEYAHSNSLILISANRQDFLSLCKTHPHSGLIILIRRDTRQKECAHLLRLIRQAGEGGLAANINFA